MGSAVRCQDTGDLYNPGDPYITPAPTLCPHTRVCGNEAPCEAEEQHPLWEHEERTPSMGLGVGAHFPVVFHSRRHGDKLKTNGFSASLCFPPPPHVINWDPP